ncbi:Putative MetA-pathway of phenol degradation [Franzmannia pantelleriensis]|uniref:Putative MetA-pathway of phenol degradation n=1 Tax=Franzmannia pantelleriensis TaxID=48727 RepID=A0A1G9EKF5_9GAMM|nr:transporter [Halomonas pantelleriensis]SDK76553.1 Putative MetA-pathway of phenol degradation [Halomonas pantelleriensis]
MMTQGPLLGLNRGAASLTLLSLAALPAAAIAQSPPPQEGEVVREAQPSQSVQNVLREEHALFSDRLTIEPGISYSYSDRSQLALSGFLVLDAIFLGNISVDTVELHTTTFDLSTRYGVSDRLEFELNLPYVYRSSNYQTIGADGSTEDSVETSVSEGGIGDVSATMFYRMLPETNSRPDIVWNLGVRAPTGKDPYGIPTREVVDGSEGNLQVPTELPTGNGVWGVSTGFSFLKTLDPAIVFANVGYTHNIERSFDNISSGEDTVSADIDLGDSYRFGFGTAFALNERFSLSMSYSHQYSQKSRITQDGESRSIVGSDATAGSVNFGATYGLNNNTSVITNVSVGLTDDAPDLVLSFRMPFQL